ncbi:hypothetical protein K2173_021053 [Erythroxylum novogranatense]|uniref:Peroxidase n=1 Tax=Erythroxylum novogranatense TaxID=1862640 RepID=A0AAV8TPJ3_9ROSI|nr:hypothetical protein K2173_021053 [Erythroxylum novogranatense]
MKMTKVAACVLLLGLIFNLTAQGYGQLRVGFYEGKCRLNVESIVHSVVRAKFLRDPAIVVGLLHMHFHDCFVHGCDASILLEGSSSEKTAAGNQNVRGYDIIDDAKTALQKLCPQVPVSCADIIVMATRDAVSLSNGGMGWYQVETGRRDGVVSLAKDVILPPPRFSVSQAVQMFRTKGLTPTEMVYLIGSHTVGTAHCKFFQDRLYNFQNTGAPDPTMNSTLLKVLRSRCPRDSDGSNIVNLDQNSSSADVVDKSYFQQIQMHNGVLQIDQELALNPLTRSIVASIASGNDFFIKFGEVMTKLGRMDVLTGSQGQIRNSCRAINRS